jgi:hypothetical protein
MRARYGATKSHRISRWRSRRSPAAGCGAAGARRSTGSGFKPKSSLLHAAMALAKRAAFARARTTAEQIQAAVHIASTVHAVAVTLETEQTLRTQPLAQAA